MLHYITSAQREELVKAQQADLNFDWFDQRGASIDKRYAVADTIFEIVKTTVDYTNPIPALFNVQRGEAGKKIKAKRLYGGVVYERSYGEYKKVSMFKNTFYTLTTTPKALHISVPVEELQAGVVTIPELADAAAKAILFHKVNMVWKTLYAATTTSGTNYTNVGASLTQSSLDTAIKTMADRHDLAGLFGRRKFLDPILTYSGYNSGGIYSPAMIDEITARGFLGQYRGVNLYPMQALKDEARALTTPTDGVAFLIAKNKDYNRYVEVTPLTTTNKVEQDDGSFHLYFQWEDGFAIWESEYIHRIWDGSTTS